MGKRRKFSPAKKVELLREHLKNGIPLSDICARGTVLDTVTLVLTYK